MSIAFKFYKSVNIVLTSQGEPWSIDTCKTFIEEESDQKVSWKLTKDDVYTDPEKLADKEEFIIIEPNSGDLEKRNDVIGEPGNLVKTPYVDILAFVQNRGNLKENLFLLNEVLFLIFRRAAAGDGPLSDYYNDLSMNFERSEGNEYTFVESKKKLYSVELTLGLEYM